MSSVWPFSICSVIHAGARSPGFAANAKVEKMKGRKEKAIYLRIIKLLYCYLVVMIIIIIVISDGQAIYRP